MTKDELLQIISSNITDNNSGDITAEKLRNTLNSMVEYTPEMENVNLDGYLYISAATPSTTPVTLTGDEKVFYIATEEGDYSNFGLGNISELSIIKSDGGTWIAQGLGVPFPKECSFNIPLQNGYYETSHDALASSPSGTSNAYKYAFFDVDMYDVIQTNCTFVGTDTMAHTLCDSDRNIIKKYTNEIPTFLEISKELYEVQGVRKVLIQFGTSWDENSYVKKLEYNNQIPFYSATDFGKYLCINREGLKKWQDLGIKEDVTHLQESFYWRVSSSTNKASKSSSDTLKTITVDIHENDIVYTNSNFIPTDAVPWLLMAEDLTVVKRLPNFGTYKITAEDISMGAKKLSLCYRNTQMPESEFYCRVYKTVKGVISDLKSDAATLKSDMSDATGGTWFKAPLKYINKQGVVIDTPNQNAITDFLDISDVSSITIKGRSTQLVSLYAFYNADKQFIGGISGEEYADKYITIDRADFPEGAKFFVGNGFNDPSRDYLHITDIQELFKLTTANKQNSVNIGIDSVGTMGASLMDGTMYNPNTWVEKGCRILGINAINKAKSGVGSPAYFANLLWRDEYCSGEEFEKMDILAIQFASSGDVYLESNTKTIDEYENALDTSLDNPFDTIPHSEAFDYILKKWQKRCLEQKNNANSKWYGKPYGKPCRLMFVTHWHDGRVAYNESIRRLADKWGAGICELDRNIGFSKNQPLEDGTQVSTLFSIDITTSDGVTYGWHPLRGTEGEYIQTKMGNTFAEALKRQFSMTLM